MVKPMPFQSAQELTIGQVAAAAGVNKETIRYYERCGLLRQPDKPAYSIRRYPSDAVARIRFIKHAQGLGFTLAEIQELLALRTSEHTPCSEVKHRAERKLVNVQQKIQALMGLERTLEQMVHACAEERMSEEDCPILRALDAPEMRME